MLTKYTFLEFCLLGGGSLGLGGVVVVVLGWRLETHTGISSPTPHSPPEGGGRVLVLPRLNLIPRHVDVPTFVPETDSSTADEAPGSSAAEEWKWE